MQETPRSGSQKALLIISIIQIIGAIGTLALGALFFIGAGAVGQIQLGDVDLNSLVQGIAGELLMAIGSVIVVSGIISLLCGVFGVRAANNNQKIMIVWVCLLIALVFQIIVVALLAFAAINGDVGGLVFSTLVELAWSCLMFWIANNIKREAGK